MWRVRFGKPAKRTAPGLKVSEVRAFLRLLKTHCEDRDGISFRAGESATLCQSSKPQNPKRPRPDNCGEGFMWRVRFGKPPKRTAPGLKVSEVCAFLRPLKTHCDDASVRLQHPGKRAVLCVFSCPKNAHSRTCKA